MNTLISDEKLNMQPPDSGPSYLLSLPALDGGNCATAPISESPNVSRLLKLGKGLIKHPEQSPSRSFSLSHTLQERISLSESKMNAIHNINGSILKDTDVEHSLQTASLSIPANIKKRLPQLRRSMRKPKGNTFVVDDALDSSGQPFGTSAMKELDGSVGLLKSEKRLSQSQHALHSCGRSRPFVTPCNTYDSKGALDPENTSFSRVQQRLSNYTSTPVAAASSRFPIAMGTLQQKPISSRPLSASFEPSHKFNRGKSTSPDASTQRLIRVESKVSMTSVMMNEVKRQSRVSPYVRTNEERYREVLEKEHSKLISLLGRKFNLEKSIEAVLDAFETDMSHKRDTSSKLTNGKGDAPASISRLYSTSKGGVNRRRASVYLYRAEEIRKLNQINNAFLSNLVRDDFDMKSIYRLIESLESQLRSVCERAGMAVPEQVPLNKKWKNSIQTARSNFNDIRWQIESMDLGLNTDVDLPDDLTSACITEPLLGWYNFLSSEKGGSPLANHTPGHLQDISDTKQNLSPLIHSGERDRLALLSSAKPDHATAESGESEKVSGSILFTQTPDPSVVGFSLLEDSIVHDKVGILSLKLLGFMFDAIAAAQVADSLRSRGPLFPEAAEPRKSSGGDNFQPAFQMSTLCPQTNSFPEQSSEGSLLKIPSSTVSEAKIQNEPNVDTDTGATTTTTNKLPGFTDSGGGKKQSTRLGDSLQPLYLNSSSNRDDRNDDISLERLRSGVAVSMSSGVKKPISHATTLRPDLIYDLKKLYKEYDYHHLIEDRRLLKKALSAGRNADGEAYIAELDEKIRRAKMLAMENQKSMEPDEEASEISNIIDLMRGIGTTSSAYHSSVTSRELNCVSSPHPRSQSTTPIGQIYGLDNCQEDNQTTQEKYPLDLKQTKSGRSLYSTETSDTPEEDTESRGEQGGTKVSPYPSPMDELLQDHEQILLSTQIPCGLAFTITRKLLPDSAPPISKKSKNKKRAKIHSKTRQSSDRNSSEDTTQALCVRIRNENRSSPCEATIQLNTEKLVNLTLLPLGDFNDLKTDGVFKVLLEPGETKTLALLDSIDKNKHFEFDEAFFLTGDIVSRLDKFNSLHPLSSGRKSDSFSIFSNDIKIPLSSPSTKKELNKGTQRCLSKMNKVSATTKVRRASRKPASSGVHEVLVPSLKPTNEAEEEATRLMSGEDSKKGATLRPVPGLEQAPLGVGSPDGGGDGAALGLLGSFPHEGIVDDLLQPREVVDWGIPHEDPEKEAIENNMVLLSILQTQAESEAEHSLSSESKPYELNGVEVVLQGLSLSGNDPLKDLHTAEAVVAGIVQRIAEDVRAEGDEELSRLDTTQNAARDALSVVDGMAQFKSHTNDIDAAQDFQVPQVKLEDAHMRYPVLPESLTPTSPSPSRVLSPFSATHRMEGDAEPHGPLCAVLVNDSFSEQTTTTPGEAMLTSFDAETVAVLDSTSLFSGDKKVKSKRKVQRQGYLRPLKGSESSRRPRTSRRIMQLKVYGMGSPRTQEVIPRRSRISTEKELYEFNKDLNDEEMQHQLTSALKEISKNAPEAFVSRSEATGKLNVLMPSNLMSDPSQLSNLLGPNNRVDHVDDPSNLISKAEMRIQTPGAVHDSSKIREEGPKANKPAATNACSAYVANILNMAKSSPSNQRPVSSKTIKKSIDIGVNDVLTFSDASLVMQSTSTMENIKEETHLLYMQDPVRYNAVVDEFMGLVASELQESPELPDSSGNKDPNIGGFLTDNMKLLIKKFMNQKIPKDGILPAEPLGESNFPSELLLDQNTSLQKSNRTSVSKQDSLRRRSSCTQGINLVPVLPSALATEAPLSSTNSRMRGGAIKYDDSHTSAHDGGLVAPPFGLPSLKQEAKTEYVEQELQPSSKIHSINDSASEIQRLLYEQFKAKLILSIFVSYTRRMWILKQKEASNNTFQMITKTMSRTTQVAWEFEKHRVLELKKLIHILDRQTGRQRGWIPYYTNNNVLVKQGMELPCPRCAHFEEHRRLRQAMCFARRGRILPLSLVHQDIVRSWNKHLLLGYSRYVVDDRQSTEDRKRTTGGKYIPIRYFQMRSPGERARYARRARFGAAFQFPSKRFSPRIYRERDFPLALH